MAQGAAMTDTLVYVLWFRQKPQLFSKIFQAVYVKICTDIYQHLCYCEEKIKKGIVFFTTIDNGIDAHQLLC